MSVHRAWPLLVSLLLAVVASAEVYVWIDAEGGTHMSGFKGALTGSRNSYSSSNG